MNPKLQSQIDSLIAALDSAQELELLLPLEIGLVRQRCAELQQIRGNDTGGTSLPVSVSDNLEVIDNLPVEPIAPVEPSVSPVVPEAPAPEVPPAAPVAPASDAPPAQPQSSNP